MQVEICVLFLNILIEEVSMMLFVQQVSFFSLNLIAPTLLFFPLPSFSFILFLFSIFPLFIDVPWNSEFKLQVIKHSANGIAYLHSKKLIHRDLKSQNLLMTRDFVVKVTDVCLLNFNFTFF